LHRYTSGATSMVPGWYRCVDSIMTVLLQTPEVELHKLNPVAP
jgi:hypothetical protein